MGNMVPSYQNDYILKILRLHFWAGPLVSDLLLIFLSLNFHDIGVSSAFLQVLMSGIILILLKEIQWGHMCKVWRWVLMWVF